VSMDAPNEVNLENVTKRGPGHVSKAERDAADIAAARARAAATPRPALSPEPQRDVVAAASSPMAEPLVPFEPTAAGTFELYPAPPVGKLKAMELKRNYRPVGAFEIVGHTQPEIKRKNAIGVMEVVQKQSFVPGEMAPPPVPGVTFTHKIWAGTVIRVPIDEAKTMRANSIAEPSLEDD
jgi:hypothetical protein